MVRKLCGIAALGCIFAATPAEAQLPGLEIEPYIGVFVPGTDVVEDQLEAVDIKFGHQESFALGGRVTFWLFGPLGLEGNLMYAFSDVEVGAEAGTLFGVSETEDAYFWAADARLLWNLLPLGPIGVHVDGGIATINHGGDFYDIVTDGKSSVGGVLGGGVRVKLPGLLGVRVDADAYVYSIELSAVREGITVPDQFESQFQADFVLSAGLILSIGP